MYSVLMTGYMFRNAQYRMGLQQSLEQVALPDGQDKKVCGWSCFAYLLFVMLWIGKYGNPSNIGGT